jgi:polysaccharide export outer membrane protein
MRPPDSIYKIGIGDVLDIHLSNASAGQSTLFTVTTGGLLDYPAIGEPFVAGGMTTEELSAKLGAELKRRAIIDDDKVIVSIRDYSSHRVLVSGLVDQPGAKILQREAVPLFVVLAQAAPRPEAGRAVITSATNPVGKVVNLSDSASTNILVGSGDVVHVIARPQEFIYVGGEIMQPGRKDFHAGVTLTQVLLECGGVTRPNSTKTWVRVSRQDPNGRLVSQDYKLVDVESGQIADPPIQPGDRIIVERDR